MTYSYAYKTPDGVRHEDAIDAPSRDAAFAELRKRGIRPIKVVAADGSKANGEVRGVRKRIVAAIAAFVALIAGGVAFWAGETTSDATILDLSSTRRQVIGDAAVVAQGIRTGWADVFGREGDRFLASFAIPGVKAGVRNTSVEEIERALGETAAPSAADSLESRQIKAMVEGMKSEARRYLAAGGTAVEYGKRLVERQDAEIAVRKRAEAEIMQAWNALADSSPTSEFAALLERRNDELRNLGIRPITLPEEK